MIYQIPNLTLTENKSLSGIYVSDRSQHDSGIDKVMGNIVVKFILLRDFRRRNNTLTLSAHLKCFELLKPRLICVKNMVQQTQPLCCKLRGQTY